MPSVTLYTFATSPYGLKVQAYLAYKRIPYDIVYASPFNLKRELPVVRTVPVVTIDGESRNESQQVARGLDERYPERPLFPDGDDGECVRALDDWVQHCLITANFEFAFPRLSPMLAVQVMNAWRLGSIVDQTTPDGAVGWLPALWPVVLRAAPFVRREAARAPGKSVFDTVRRGSNRVDSPRRPSLARAAAIAGSGAGPARVGMGAYRWA